MNNLNEIAMGDITWFIPTMEEKEIIQALSFQCQVFRKYVSIIYCPRADIVTMNSPVDGEEVCEDDGDDFQSIPSEEDAVCEQNSDKVSNSCPKVIDLGHVVWYVRLFKSEQMKTRCFTTALNQNCSFNFRFLIWIDLLISLLIDMCNIFYQFRRQLFVRFRMRPINLSSLSHEPSPWLYPPDWKMLKDFFERQY